MKLILVLTLVAFGYAAKLDRTYLPPSNAANAGGSPGALTAPGSNNESFGQRLPTISEIPTNSNSQNFGQNIPNAFRQPELEVSRDSLGPNSSINPSRNLNDDSNTQSSIYGQGFNKINSNSPSSGPYGTSLGQNQQPIEQGFGQVDSKPERVQASADRNAEILKYINENNGDSYTYSYETSNGIAADESGVATNGVNAKGGYSYTGDDGIVYAVTYTADENGYQPQGDHLPTPHPIPEEILKSIELNAKAAASGTQEGAYRPEEYESNASTSKNQSQQPITSSTRDSGFSKNPSEEKAFLPSNYFQKNSDKKVNQISEVETNQGQPEQSFAGIESNSNRPQVNRITTQFQRPGQGPQSFENLERETNQISQNQIGQNQKSGYNYDKPQKNTQPSNQYFEPDRYSGIRNQNKQYPTFSPDSKTNILTEKEASQSNFQFKKPQGPAQEAKTSFGTQQGPADRIENGFNYNQPQKSIKHSNQPSGFGNQERRPDQFSTDSKTNGFIGQIPDKTTNQVNQSNQPGQEVLSSFRNYKGQSEQNQLGDGYKYNQPQKSYQAPEQFSGFESQAKYPENPFSGSKKNGLPIESAGHSVNMFSKSQTPGQGFVGMFENKQNQAQKLIPNVESNGALSSQQQQNSQTTSKNYVSPFGNKKNQGNQNNQGQSESGYNYSQPQKSEKNSNQFLGFGNQQEQSQKYVPGFQVNDKQSTRQQANQLNMQYNRPQQTVQNSTPQIENQKINQNRQGQASSGYNYYQPQKSTQISNQLSGFGKQQEQPFSSENNNKMSTIERDNQNTRPLAVAQRPNQGFGQPSEFETKPGNNVKISSPSYQINSQLNQPKRLFQSSQPASDLQEKQSKEYFPGQMRQTQDENGYYYNRPQSSFNTPGSQEAFGQISAQSKDQNQSGFSTQPGSIYQTTAFNKSQRPDQGPQYSDSNNGKIGLVPTNAIGSSFPSQTIAQGSTLSQPQMMFGNINQVSQNRPGGNVALDGSTQPLNQFQSNPGNDESKFQPQPNLPGDRQSSSTFGSPMLPQRQNQRTSPGYDYSQPGQNSQSNRLVSNANGNQGFNESPVNKDSSARPEFGGPRQPPSFSPEEGYIY